MLENPAYSISPKDNSMPKCFLQLTETFFDSFCRLSIQPRRALDQKSESYEYRRQKAATPKYLPLPHVMKNQIQVWQQNISFIAFNHFKGLRKTNRIRVL
jgi:hypothetical protein